MTMLGARKALQLGRLQEKRQSKSVFSITGVLPYYEEQPYRNLC